MEALEDYRKEIDEIDKELTQLFEKRMDVVLKVAKYKKDNSVGVLQKGREDEVLKKALDNLQNKDYSDELIKFLNATMEISRGLQKRMIDLDNKLADIKVTREAINKNSRVGFPGVAGAFTEEALLKFFGEECNRTAYEEFEDVFQALQIGAIDYGIIPIENSSTGAISDTYDLLRKYGFYIVGEECIRIEQHLVGIKGSIIEEIDEIYSHPQGIEQSSDFLKQYHHWKLIPFHNTAISAKLIEDLGDTTKAAIASKRAADIYGLDIIKECINNQKDNYTRFIIIAPELKAEKEADKVSVVFSLENEAGTLFRLLRHFAENNINMIKIESRPMKDSFWKYFLYVDFEGDIESNGVRNALELIEKNSAYFKLLGSYKKIN
ncbi:prephenate dehydratase [Clostridium paraputrificum]|uniref:prephenate dehydratase n=1 Tax=Clostridium TaxID=1485 RepID=UPI003D3415C9